MGKKGFVKGGLIGGLVGAVAALLLAPKSGKETREDVKKAVDTGRDNIKEVIDNSREDIEEKLKIVGDELAEKGAEFKRIAKELTAEAKDESTEIMARTNVLKQDIKLSLVRMAENNAKTGEATIKSARGLLDESSKLLKEIERVGKKVGASAKDKVKETAKDDAKAEKKADTKPAVKGAKK